MNVFIKMSISPQVLILQSPGHVAWVGGVVQCWGVGGGECRGSMGCCFVFSTMFTIHCRDKFHV